MSIRASDLSLPFFREMSSVKSGHITSCPIEIHTLDLDPSLHRVRYQVSNHQRRSARGALVDRELTEESLVMTLVSFINIFTAMSTSQALTITNSTLLNSLTPWQSPNLIVDRSYWSCVSVPTTL